MASGTDRRRVRRTRLAVGGAMIGAGLLIAGLGLLWPGLALCALALVGLAQRQGVPVICYHSVSPDASGWLPWAANTSVRPEVFAAQMRHLHRAGWSVVPDAEIHAGQTRGKVLALHFDDACHDITLYALPVLRDLGMPATVFASSDFIDPSTGLRDTPQQGYMNADELRATDHQPLFSVACHGKDHAKGPVPGPARTRAAKGWDRDSDYLWSLLPGDKARWFDQPAPAPAEIPTLDSRLCARLLHPDGQETEAERSARVRHELASAKTRLEEILGHPVTALCWPFDRWTPEALADARAVGFERFTGGRVHNRPGTPLDILSRTHVHDFAAGEAPLWVEVLAFRARLEVASGNLLWWPLMIGATLRRCRDGRFHRWQHQS